MPSAMVILCTMKSFQNGLCLLDISEERLKLTFHPEENWSKKKKKITWTLDNRLGQDTEFNFPIPTTASAAC